jgi:hypothetical protein
MSFDNLIHTLRDGKELLRSTRRSASVAEKLLDLWRAQHVYVEIVGNRRPLKPWEKPWNIMSDVRDAVIIRDAVIEPMPKKVATVTASPSHWVRPRERWTLQV